MEAMTRVVPVEGVADVSRGVRGPRGARGWMGGMLGFGKALLKEGWKVEAEMGEVLVVGRNRR